MTVGGIPPGGVPGQLQLLTFSVMGVKMGADTDQISEMLDTEAAAGRGTEIYRFDEKIPFRSGPVIYRSPVVLMIKT